MATSVRLLIYGRGTDEQVKQQHNECYAAAELLTGYRVVSVASDPPGGWAGWDSAKAMVRAGEVDRILVASREIIPVFDVLETVTGEIRRSAMRQGPSERRRPRRIRGFGCVLANWGSVLAALLSTLT